MTIPSYGKILNLGHAQIADLFSGPVTAEEKIDGSQFAGRVVAGHVYCRSRGKQIDPEAPEKMFASAVETVNRLATKLHDGWIYRGEVLSKPKHNVLCYDRVPEGNIIIFDIDIAQEAYLPHEDKVAECERIGLECVPLIFSGEMADFSQLDEMLNRESCLGGVPIEGVVFKAYGLFGRDGKTLMGKHVSERFKESHSTDWKLRHPAGTEIKRRIIEQFRTEARWNKAVAHLRDEGVLADEPKDIGPLMKELNQDFDCECAEGVKEMLWQWARKDIIRGVTRGFPEWFKEQLAKSQFAEAPIAP